MVLRVLAVPLPVPPAGPPTGEQELQESLLRWVTTESFIVSKSTGLNLSPKLMNNTSSIVLFFSVFLPDYSLPLPSKGDHGKLRFCACI